MKKTKPDIILAHAIEQAQVIRVKRSENSKVEVYTRSGNVESGPNAGMARFTEIAYPNSFPLITNNFLRLAQFGAAIEIDFKKEN